MTNQQRAGARAGLHGGVAGTGCRGWLPGGGPHRVGDATNQDKNRAVRGHARATPPPIQLSSNPEIFFVFLGNLYGIPGNPMGHPRSLLGG